MLMIPISITILLIPISITILMIPITIKILMIPIPITNFEINLTGADNGDKELELFPTPSKACFLLHFSNHRHSCSVSSITITKTKTKQ